MKKIFWLFLLAFLFSLTLASNVYTAEKCCIYFEGSSGPSGSCFDMAQNPNDMSEQEKEEEKFDCSTEPDPNTRFEINLKGGYKNNLTEESSCLAVPGYKWYKVDIGAGCDKAIEIGGENFIKTVDDLIKLENFCCVPQPASGGEKPGLLCAPPTLIPGVLPPFSCTSISGSGQLTALPGGVPGMVTNVTDDWILVENKCDSSVRQELREAYGGQKVVRIGEYCKNIKNTERESWCLCEYPNPANRDYIVCPGSDMTQTECAEQEQTGKKVCKSYKPDSGEYPNGCKSLSSAEAKDTGSSYSQLNLEGLNQLKARDLPTLIGQVLQAGMGILGMLALIMFIYGGVTFMMAMGNSESQKKAISTLTWASIGIIVILASFAIVQFLFKAFK
ncbi:MAG: pilin [Candidatus Magasanikiibacteriota bacterium]